MSNNKVNKEMKEVKVKKEVKEDIQEKEVKIKAKTKVKATVEEKYQKMEQHEHILKLPDTYIGSIVEDSLNMWVFDDATKKIILKPITYVPGLYKLFDEIVVNARDHTIKDKTCKTIKITIDPESNTISCFNDGQDGIPVVIHKEHQLYIPEMIFSYLLTSGNYNQKGKTVGGKNGYGAKLVNIFSTEFTIEVIDHVNKKKFIQCFRDNMYTRDKPIITDLVEKPGKVLKSSVLITFKPDLEKFKIESLTDDIVALFKKRVYDIAALTREDVKVYLNGEEIVVKTFEKYIDMYCNLGEEEVGEEVGEEELDTESETKTKNKKTKKNKNANPNLIYEEINERWRLGVLYDPNPGYRQISYVNGICTFKGGTHVSHVVDNLVGALAAFINNKHKGLNVKPAHIKDNLTVFIDSIIEDPSFGSQTKEELTTKLSNFGSRCDITDDFIKRLAKTGIVDEVVNFAKLKAMAELKKTDGKKKENLRGIEKLTDAHWAGGKKSKYCKLILTEGDSAKTYAMAGLEVIGRDKYGVFPLKGKLLNVREKNPKQILDNEEIAHLKEIIGLKQGKVYTEENIKELRYGGGIVCLTDQDHDGSHIKGLLMNLFHFFWPSLLKIPGFIQSYSTPIVKVWKKTDIKRINCKVFYNLSDYSTWKDTFVGSIESHGWAFKYYKGLGTSDDKEAMQSFIDYDNKVINYVWDDKLVIKKQIVDSESGEDVEAVEVEEENKEEEEIIREDKTNECYNAITLAFSKTRANDRKRWLESYKKDDVLDFKVTKVLYSNFVNKELIHFSNADCIRSIPSMCDGLKPSQRKIIYVCFKKKLFKDEIKVSQLSGYVSAESAYHHGEVSLQSTMIGLAQKFVGANNLFLLKPIGNFGSRKAGGHDSASPRYITTMLNEVNAYLFRKEDECVYNYVDDDGDVVEPDFYMPIIPLVLVNGVSGIGTGFSTNIPPYNPLSLVNNIKKLLKNKDKTIDVVSLLDHITPWFRGFTGKVTKIDNETYTTSGILEIINETTVVIKELPIGVWMESYVTFLHSMEIKDKKNKLSGEIFTNVKDDCGNNKIFITLSFAPGELQKLLNNNKLHKTLRLVKSLKISNMHLYNSKNVIKKYSSVNSIIKDYYDTRLGMYTKRKIYYLRVLENRLNVIKFKIKFLKLVISEEIVMFKKGVSTKKEIVIENLERLKFPKLNSNFEDLNVSYSYITNILLFHITPEEMAKLEKEYEECKLEVDTYKNTSVEDIWMGELIEFEVAYNKWLANLIEEDEDEVKVGKKVVKKGKVKV
jgi:DNA topoisomerase-2